MLIFLQTYWLSITLSYLILNLVSFTFYGVDKRKARQGAYRIPEKTLFVLSLLGPIGALTGMYLHHHKTRKPAFRILVPFFLLLHIAGMIALLIW